MQGKIAEAEKTLEEASRLEAQNPYIWSALAEVYRRAHDNDGAAGAARKAEQYGGKISVIEHALAMYYSKSGDLRKAAELEARYATTPNADGAAWNRAAHWYLQAGDEAQALPLAQRAATQDATVAFEWGDYLLHRQQFTEAAEVVTAALASHPHEPQLLLTLGVARYGQRRFEEAITAFLKVIEQDPTVEQPYLFIGRMLEQAGPHLPEIRQAYEARAERNPDNAEAQLLLAKVLLLENHTSERAESLLRRSLALDQNKWEAHYELGVLLEDRRDYQAASAELVRSGELNPKEPMLHYHLARVYDRLGQPERAAAERDLHQRLTAAKTP